MQPSLLLRPHRRPVPELLLSAGVLLMLIHTGHAEPPPPPSKPGIQRARERAALLQGVYSSTLTVMHQRYFHGDRAAVPARAMEDIFRDIKQSEKIEANWISVNLRPMSLNHRPSSDFEKHAAAQIKAGKREVERVEGNWYRRAIAIPLAGGCIGCHDPSLSPSPTPKFAGLVVSIPLGDADRHREPSR